jgi:hypothetical protein
MLQPSHGAGALDVVSSGNAAGTAKLAVGGNTSDFVVTHPPTPQSEQDNFQSHLDVLKSLFQDCLKASKVDSDATKTDEASKTVHRALDSTHTLQPSLMVVVAVVMMMMMMMKVMTTLLANNCGWWSKSSLLL